MIIFEIKGNQENPHGNPIPKLKMTKGQQWSPKAQRYARWKEYVQDCFYKQTKNRRKLKKPIEGAPKGIMDLKIHWADGKHADPESIFGSIADALFQNDKNLDGSFESRMSPDKKGRVEVKIKFTEDEQ